MINLKEAKYKCPIHKNCEPHQLGYCSTSSFAVTCTASNYHIADYEFVINIDCNNGDVLFWKINLPFKKIFISSDKISNSTFLEFEGRKIHCNHFIKLEKYSQLILMT